ncbi:hypothetical protein GWI33_012031 [Rhynchophorus ferrugineus]|uniref:MADF domain-containing protein n=1 Tax=Rhynchophorus ferrugineus TaxID=354439 RepID=A0A834IJJ7_RHYFE|nr:hypothetical protein GWI33_012031 [Rhynchophorus ferrugineus]
MGQEIKKIVDAQLKFEYKLVQIIQYHECLYNTSHQSFNDELYRNAVWESIASQLNVPSKYCRERWKGILQRFTEEIQWQNMFRATSFWLLFHHLDFLNRIAPNYYFLPMDIDTFQDTSQ